MLNTRVYQKEGLPYASYYMFISKCVYLIEVRVYTRVVHVSTCLHVHLPHRAGISELKNYSWREEGTKVPPYHARSAAYLLAEPSKNHKPSKQAGPPTAHQHDQHGPHR